MLTVSLSRIHVKGQATTGFRPQKVVALGDAVNYGLSLCLEPVSRHHTCVMTGADNLGSHNTYNKCICLGISLHRFFIMLRNDATSAVAVMCR